MLQDMHKEEVSGKGFIYHAPDKYRGASGTGIAGIILGGAGAALGTAAVAKLAGKMNKHECGPHYGGYGYGYGAYPAPYAAQAPVVVVKDEDRRGHGECDRLSDYRYNSHEYESKEAARLREEIAKKDAELAKKEAEFYAFRAADDVEDKLNARITCVEGKLSERICDAEKGIVGIRHDLSCLGTTTQRDYREVNARISGVVESTNAKFRDTYEDFKTGDRELRAFCDCTFVPQEKGYMDGRRVNFHRCEPVVGTQRQNLCVCNENPCDRDDRRNDRREDFVG